MAEEIRARLIFEILGRPPAHIKQSLTSLVEKIDSEKDVKIIAKTIHDPKKVEKGKDLFTTFAEVEVELGSLRALFGLIFVYFPSNVEILSPRNLRIGNEDINDLMNGLVARLHNYDAIVKKMLAERDMVYKKLIDKGIDLQSIMKELAEETKSDKVDKKKSKKKKN